MTIPVKGTFTFDWSAQSDYPSWGSAQFKQNLNARDEELKSALNAVADMLNSTALGVGGADNIGATAPTGLTGVTVQAILSALKTAIDTHSVDVTTAHGINNYAKAVQEAWIPFTFQNGFTNMGTTHPPAGYMKDSLGFVHIRGTVTNGVLGNAIATLPVGYRPAATTSRFSTTSYTPGNTPPWAICLMQVESSGVIAPIVNGGGIGSEVNLDGISYKAEN